MRHLQPFKTRKYGSWPSRWNVGGVCVRKSVDHPAIPQTETYSCAQRKGWGLSWPLIHPPSPVHRVIRPLWSGRTPRYVLVFSVQYGIDTRVLRSGGNSRGTASGQSWYSRRYLRNISWVRTFHAQKKVFHLLYVHNLVQPLNISYLTLEVWIK